MLIVDPDGTIHLTRGDNAKLNIAINDEVTHTAYIIQPNDKLTLSVRKTISTPYVFQKHIIGSSQFSVVPSDTSDLIFGEYEYDVQLTTSDNEIYTVIPPTTFDLLREVTY